MRKICAEFLEPRNKTGLRIAEHPEARNILWLRKTLCPFNLHALYMSLDCETVKNFTRSGDVIQRDARDIN